MAKGFKYGAGGGTSLNFKVIGNPQPETAKDNTIWVNTDVKITGWIFSATQPETAAEGVVWFATGTSSAVEFNALKKNSIMVYPMSAKQYVNGAWVNKTAKSYQNGESVDWVTFLLNGSNTFNEITGGWETYKHASSGYNMGNATFGSHGVTLDASDTKAVCITTKNKISFTNHEEIVVLVTQSPEDFPDNFCLYFTTGRMTEANSNTGYVAKFILRQGVNNITIPDGVKNGEYYVNVGCHCYGTPQSNVAKVEYIYLQ